MTLIMPNAIIILGNGAAQNNIVLKSKWRKKRHHGQKDYDVVLVGVDKIEDLKKAYPNYFVDTTEFLKYIREIVRHNVKT